MITMPTQPFYHSHIRNTIVAFGSLFSSLKVQRKNKLGVIEQTIVVPIAYSQKEKWVHAIEGNADEDNITYTSLPRLGFEITGYSYDATRSLNRANTITCYGADGRAQILTPAPYNIDIALYFATKTQEDGLQILEQILPSFRPELTLGVMAVPELNIVQQVPFVLNSVSVQDDYEGDLETRRFVIHTLTFTAKVNLYGGLGNVGVIKEVDVNVATSTEGLADRLYEASQSTPVDPIVESWMDGF